MSQLIEPLGPSLAPTTTTDAASAAAQHDVDVSLTGGIRPEDAYTHVARPSSVPALGRAINFRELLEAPFATPDGTGTGVSSSSPASPWAASGSHGASSSPTAHFPSPQKRRIAAKQPMVLGPMGHMMPRVASRASQPPHPLLNPTPANGGAHLDGQHVPYQQQQYLQQQASSPVRPATAGTANGPMPAIIGQRPAVTLKIRR